MAIFLSLWGKANMSRKWTSTKMPDLACNELLQPTFTHHRFNQKLWIIFTFLNENLHMKVFTPSSYLHIKLCLLANQWTEDYPAALSLARPSWFLLSYSFILPSLCVWTLFCKGHALKHVLSCSSVTHFTVQWITGLITLEMYTHLHTVKKNRIHCKITAFKKMFYLHNDKVQYSNDKIPYSNDKILCNNLFALAQNREYYSSLKKTTWWTAKPETSRIISLNKQNCRSFIYFIALHLYLWPGSCPSIDPSFNLTLLKWICSASPSLCFYVFIILSCFFLSFSSW